MTDDRKPLPAEAEMVLVPREPTDEMLRSALAVEFPATYRDHLRHPMDGPTSAGVTEKRISIFRKQFAVALTAAPKATETPGLRDALEEAEAGLSAMLRLSDMGFAESLKEPEENGNFASYERARKAREVARAALSATPQPVAVPDDGAGRDELTELIDFDRRAAASSLSAERAAHKQTQFAVGLAESDHATTHTKLLDAEAEVVRLRKALDAIEPLVDATAKIEGSATFTLAWLKARVALTAARSSREEGK